MIQLRATGHHADDCVCKRCLTSRADTSNVPVTGEPFLFPPDHALRHRPSVTYVTR